MTKKIRLIILLVCAVCFLVGALILIPYSMGYRYDFKKNKITEIGGIYVRSFPAADKVTVDSRIFGKPKLLSSDVFVQNLIPDEHSVLVEKIGYYDYFKTIIVEQKEVTKLENILLIKKNIQFNISTGIADQSGKPQSPFISQDKYIIKNNNLYYSNILENSKLTALQKSTPILKKILAFTIQNNNIIWLNTDGFIYKSDLTKLSAIPEKITKTALKIIKTGTYKIISYNKNFFVNNNGSLLFLNQKTNILDNFYSPIKGVIFSPDGKNIIYYNDNNIYISLLPTDNITPIEKILLYKSSTKITSCIWLNSSYIIFTTNNKIIISEIDYRGHINLATLPQTIDISVEQKINLEKPQIFFSQHEGKLYILNNKILISSEKISS
ncbi:MAG: PEGA domain-containing protein [Candidatus Staskawiczbacteria bacterium]|jgi:hypothetical protein